MTGKKVEGRDKILSLQESYAWHKSCTNESDDRSNNAISLNEVQRRVPDGLIHAESFGELQLSLGKAAPPRVSIDSLIFNSSSGKEGGERGCSASSPEPSDT